MTKRRFAGPVKVETRRNRSRKREPRTSPQPIIVADRTMFKPAPVRQNEVQAPHVLTAIKTRPRPRRAPEPWPTSSPRSSGMAASRDGSGRQHPRNPAA